MPRLQRAVPVLQVKDVARSIDWYVKLFGFEADPFPATPPFGFAMLRRDDAEIMLQCSDAPPALKSTTPADAGWAVYLRTSGDDLLELAAAVRRVTPVRRGPERMFYGLVEFEVEDPDGYRVCVSGSLPASANVPLARE
jgi:catechol 2,3-dioxygenase-like lactoylglutathione lyase family enzyme